MESGTERMTEGGCVCSHLMFFFFSSRRRHTRLQGDWSSDVCSSDLIIEKYEWLGSLSSFIVACFGIFFDNVCGGVVVYSIDYAENLGVWDEYGYTGKIVCLSRGACVHWAHKHAGSKLIRTSMKMLPERFKVVTCTTDETAGEIGILYQAANFAFVQMKGSGNRASIIGPDGKHMSDRQAYDIYGTRSIKKLRELGLNVVSVPRKNRYFAFLGSKK